MRALFLSAPGSFEYRETASPSAEGWVRVRMRYVGICGSDIHYYTEGRIGSQIVDYPFVLGHEGSGEVSDGAGHFARGTRAYIEPAIACHQCDQCLAGRENTCRNLKFLGNPSELPGCMSDEIMMPPECIVPLPEWMGLDEAVLLEPLSIAIHAVDLSQARAGCRAAVVGAGPVGLLVALALSELQLREVLVSEPVPARRDKAKTIGATQVQDPGVGGAAQWVQEAVSGADVVFECAGTQEAIDDAARMLRPGGTLVLIGIPEKPGPITYDPHFMRRVEAHVVHVRRQNHETGRALRLLERRRDARDLLLTHRYAPPQAAEAFELVRQKSDGAAKVLMQFV